MTRQLERAVLAGGCFWGMQDLIRKLPGVVHTRVGYTGGDVPNATYRNHGSHAEAIEIEFDSTRISYRDLLEVFFQIHDPTTLNRQLTTLGLIPGLATAFFVARWLSTLLFGVPPHDPASFTAVALLVLFVGCAASYIPARRAATVDPLIAMPAE